MLSTLLLPLIGLGIVAAFSGLEDDLTSPAEGESDEFLDGSTAGDLLNDPETQDIISFIRQEESLDIGPGSETDEDVVAENDEGGAEDDQMDADAEGADAEDQVVTDAKKQTTTDDTDMLSKKDKMFCDKWDKNCGAGDDMVDDTEGGEMAGDISPADDPADEMDTDTLEGSAGDDLEEIEGGADTMEGAAGDDTMPADPDDEMTVDGGEDTTTGGMDEDTLTAGEEGDMLQAASAADTVTGTAGDDQILGFDTASADGGDAAELDTGADVLLGEAGNDTITGNDGDEITGGSGEDVIEVLGLDRMGESAVVVTDFDPEEDVLILVDRSGEEVTLGSDGSDAAFDPDTVVGIRSAEEGGSTEVLYDDEVIALLRGTEIETLQRETAWIANRDALVLVQFASV